MLTDKLSKDLKEKGMLSVFSDVINTNDLTTLRNLLANGINPNLTEEYHDQDSPLILAVRANNLEMVQLLLVQGADPNGPGYYDNTPLIHAVIEGNPEMVRTLLERGADPTAENRRYDTALSVAKAANVDYDPEVIGLLKQAFKERKSRA